MLLSGENMKERLLTVGLIFLFVIACRFGASTAENSTNAEKPYSDNSPPVVDTSVNGSVSESTPKPAATQAVNAVCPDPAKPCHHKEKRFDDWELSFRMPAKMAANKPYTSAPFYAVILKTYPMGEDCDGGEFIEAAEADRKREQANQLERKVFASYECPNMGAVSYEFDGKWDAKKENVLIGNFIAIYVGTTKAEADEALGSLTYPKAQLKQMKASYERIEQ